MILRKAALLAGLLVGIGLMPMQTMADSGFDLKTATAADIENSQDAAMKAYTVYVNAVKIPDLSKTDPAFAKALQLYFNDVLPGKSHLTAGEIDFMGVMARLEDKVAKDGTKLSDYSALKIFDLAFAMSQKSQRSRHQ